MALIHSAPRVAALFLLAGLCGCESAADRALKKSPDYRAGYSDGCASAGTPGANPRETSQVRDEQAFQGNRGYQLGWRTGFGACRSSSYQGPSNAASLPGQGPIPDPNPNPF